jgi:hypothetical protein
MGLQRACHRFYQANRSRWNRPRQHSPLWKQACQLSSQLDYNLPTDLSKPVAGFLRFGVRAAQIGGCYVIRGASRRPTRNRPTRRPAPMASFLLGGNAANNLLLRSYMMQAGLYRQGEPPPADAGIIRQPEVQHQADWLELGARRFEGRERHRSASRRVGRCQ